MGMAGSDGDEVTVIRRVWIEPGCIQCAWCSDLIPEVFQVGDARECAVKAGVRSDGATTPNRDERAALTRPLVDTEAGFFEFVAAGCPSLVIKFSPV